MPRSFVSSVSRQAPWEPPFPIFIPWTIYSSPAHLCQIPPSISSSPTFSKHRLIPDFIPPPVRVCVCVCVPSCALMFSTHVLVLHPWMSSIPSPTGLHFPPQTHFWFQVSSFFFSINPFVVLHRALDSVIPPKQTHSIFTLLYLLLKLSLLLSPAPVPAPSKTHCSPSCTTSITMNFVN